jgi:vacuolar protein sorting-associated protein 26
MQALFGAGAGVTSKSLDIVLAGCAGRKFRPSAAAGSEVAPLYIFSSREAVSGDVKILLQGGKRLEHSGVRIELKGVIEAQGEKAAHEFVALSLDLAQPGVLAGLAAYPFHFAAPELPHDSYSGSRARVRYFLRAIVSTRGSFSSGAAVTKDLEFLVQNASAEPPSPSSAADVALAGGPNSSVKLEVGIEDCLHIEFEYNR